MKKRDFSAHRRLYGGAGDDHYEVHSVTDLVDDSAGHDSGTVYVDRYETDPSVEDWTWARGVQKLSCWIGALVCASMPTIAASLSTARTIKYSFAPSAPTFFDADDKQDFQAFNSAQIEYTKQVLSYIEPVINLHVVETTDAEGTDTIVFANSSQEDSAGYGTHLDLFEAGSGVMVDASRPALNPSLDGGDEFLRVVTHELGHAPGLKHPFGDLQPARHRRPAVHLGSFAGRPRHGHAPDHGISYGLIGDGGGKDVIDGPAQTENLTIYLDDGYWGHIGAKADSITARGQFSINIGTTTEDAIGGSGNDHISGNEVGNNIAGGAGNGAAVYVGAHDGYLITQAAAEHRLHRAPDAAGYAYWLDVMHKGTGEGQILADFGESAGNQAQVIAQIEHGIWYTPRTNV